MQDTFSATAEPDWAHASTRVGIAKIEDGTALMSHSTTMSSNLDSSQTIAAVESNYNTTTNSDAASARQSSTDQKSAEDSKYSTMEIIELDDSDNDVPCSVQGVVSYADSPGNKTSLNLASTFPMELSTTTPNTPNPPYDFDHDLGRPMRRSSTSQVMTDVLAAIKPQKRKYTRRKPYWRNGVWVEPVFKHFSDNIDVTEAAASPSAAERRPRGRPRGSKNRFPRGGRCASAGLLHTNSGTPAKAKAGAHRVSAGQEEEEEAAAAAARYGGAPDQYHVSSSTTSVVDADSTVVKGLQCLRELEAQAKEVAEAWENDSVFREDFAETQDSTANDTVVYAGSSDDTCTPAEAYRLRQELHRTGPFLFCQIFIDSGLYTTQKLLTAFGMRAPAWTRKAATTTATTTGDQHTNSKGQSSSDVCMEMLVLAMTRELTRRTKIASLNTVDDAVRLISQSRNIIVITGAGISTSLGIPDFRSKNGLYSQLSELGLSDPQEVFSIDYFRDDPTIFYRVARDIWPSENRYTPTHKFIAMLQDRGKLLTNYTQNIDNLEAKAGIRPDKLIQCHGSFATATCIRCGHSVAGDTILADVKSGRIPRCTACTNTAAAAASKTTTTTTQTVTGTKRRKRANTASRRRRSTYTAFDFANDDDSDDNNNDSADDASFGNFSGTGTAANTAFGIMKPDITFFGEQLPAMFSQRLATIDRHAVDLIIVIGTSLKVMPVSEIVTWLPARVPQICISREPVAHVNFDIDLLGDCDDVVVELARRLGWPLEHEMAPPEVLVRVATAEGFENRHVFERVGGPAKCELKLSEREELEMGAGAGEKYGGGDNSGGGDVNGSGIQNGDDQGFGNGLSASGRPIRKATARSNLR